MKGTKRLAVLAMFTAIALTIFVAEAQIPPVVPIPGVKLGLANIVTLIAMALLGRRQAGEILLVRIVLGSVFTGGVSAMLFSIAGGVFAYFVMCLTLRRLPERLLWVVSVLAAFGHNAGQLLVAVWVTGTPSILVYAPALVAASVAALVYAQQHRVYHVEYRLLAVAAVHRVAPYRSLLGGERQGRVCRYRAVFSVVVLI